MIVDYCNVIERIKTRIKEIGSPNKVGHINKEELSIMCGMPKTTINSIIYLGRKISDKELEVISKNLYVSKEWLLTGNGKKYNPPHIITPEEQLQNNLYKYVYPLLVSNEEY